MTTVALPDDGWGRPGTHGAGFGLREAVYLVLLAGILLAPLADFLSVRAGAGVAGAGARISLFVRAGTILVLSMLLLGRGRVSRRGAWLACAAAYCMVLALWLYGIAAYTQAFLVEQIVFTFKVFSVFVYAAALRMLDDRAFRRLETAAALSLAVYAAAIVAGALLSIDMFRSYQADVAIRSGYKGIVVAQNEVSALMTVALSLAYLRVLHAGWSVAACAFVALVLMALMCVGTKAAAGNVALVTLAYLYAQRGLLRALAPAAAFMASALAVAAAAYLLVPSVREAADLSLSYFVFRYQAGSLDSVLGMVTSGRNVKLAEVGESLQHMHWLPLLAGGYPVASYMVEMDFPDLLVAFGLPVFGLYLVAWCAPFLAPAEPRVRRYGRAMLVILLLLANMAGHLMASGGVALYLAVLGRSLLRRLPGVRS